MVTARMQGGLLGAIGLSFPSCGLAQALGCIAGEFFTAEPLGDLREIQGQIGL